MFFLFKRILVLISISFLISSCGSSSSTETSDSVSTGQIYSVFEVSADNSDKIQANAVFTKQVPPSQIQDTTVYVSLGQKDHLWISNQGHLDDYNLGNRPFSELQNLIDNYDGFRKSDSGKSIESEIFQGFQIQYHMYQASVPENVDSHFYLDLLRAKDQVSTHSDVTLPPKFMIFSPSMNSSISRGTQDILINWDSLDTLTAGVTVSLSIRCPNGQHIEAQQTLTTDTGSVVVQAGTLSNSSLSGLCNATVSVDKKRIGNLDSHFYGGLMVGTRIRNVSFLTTE